MQLKNMFGHDLYGLVIKYECPIAKLKKKQSFVKKILMTYTSACRYTSDPRLTKVLRLVTLFFSRFSMFLRRSELVNKSGDITT